MVRRLVHNSGVVLMITVEIRVYRILDGTAEAESVVYRDNDPDSGFIMTPDLYVSNSFDLAQFSDTRHTQENGTRKPSRPCTYS